MRRVKRILSIFLIAIVLSLSTSFTAAAGYRYEAEALVLNKLGLFAGVSTSSFDPELGSQLQRQTAVVLLVKMFGKEAAAKAMPQSEVDSVLSKYSDNGNMAPFARCFMAYAVKTGMVVGSGTQLNPNDIIDSQSFACMILKNLGYAVNTPADFTHSLDILGGLGGISPQDIARINNKTLIRDDAVGIMYWSLKAAKTNGNPLVVALINEGFIPVNTAVQQGFVKHDAGTGKITLLPEKTTVATERDVIYGLIRDAMVNNKTSVVLPINSASDTINEVGAILEDVLAGNPTILYCTGIKTYYRTIGNLTFSFSKDTATVKSHRDLLQAKGQSVLSGIIKPNMTDYQKELAIHDYLVDHCSYDTTKPAPSESFTAYGALCLNTAVCEGYAKAMKLLLNQAGVECMFVTGTAEGQGHAWNIVKISNQYYHLDAAWDDPIMSDGNPIRTYTYFNLPGSEIARDHHDWSAAYPACTMSTFNYHDYNGYVATGRDAFVSFAVAQFKKGVNPVTVKVSDTDNPGFDLPAALLSIQNTTHVKPVMMRTIDAYGIVDLLFE